jgi:hypothetical protein
MAQVVAFPARAPAATGEVISLREAKADLRRRQRMALVVDRTVREIVRQLGDGLAWAGEPEGPFAFHALVAERLLRDHPALFAGAVTLTVEVS